MNMSPQILSPSVAIQGERYSFHDSVARRLYGDDVITENMSFPRLVESIAGAKYPKGIIAVENTSTGHILGNWDLLTSPTGTKTEIIGEYILNIVQCLLTYSTVRLEDIREVRSHPVALQQCSAYLDEHAPNARRVEVADTAASAREIAALKDPSIAAIAGADAGRGYGLTILKENIANAKVNQTRFFTLQPRTSESLLRAGEKSSLALTLHHESGSLASLLTLIAQYGGNLTQIFSRPVLDRPFEYTFIIDLSLPAGANAAALQRALEERAQSLYILGTYASAATA